MAMASRFAIGCMSEDHCRAIYSFSSRGAPARSTTSAAIARCRTWKWSTAFLKATDKPETLITRVADRPGHDRRYALTNEKLTRETGWEPRMDFDAA